MSCLAANNVCLGRFPPRLLLLLWPFHGLWDVPRRAWRPGWDVPASAGCEVVPGTHFETAARRNESLPREILSASVLLRSSARGE